MEDLGDEDLLERARASVSEYCHTACKALCCRSGRLNCKDEAQLRIVAGGRLAELRRDGLIKSEWDGTFSVVLTGSCPALNAEHRCGVYAQRPQSCRNFPLYRYANNVIVAPTCPAQEILAPFLEELRRRGFKVI